MPLLSSAVHNKGILHRQIRAALAQDGDGLNCSTNDRTRSRISVSLLFCWFYNRCELPHFVSSSTSPPCRSKNIFPQFQFGKTKRHCHQRDTELQRILFYSFMNFRLCLWLCVSVVSRV